jgi:hypothetical protein
MVFCCAIIVSGTALSSNLRTLRSASPQRGT